MFKTSDDPRDLKAQRKLMGIEPLERNTFVSSGHMSVLRPLAEDVRADEYSTFAPEPPVRKTEAKPNRAKRAKGLTEQLALGGCNTPERGAFSISRPIPVSSYRDELHDGISEEQLMAQSFRKLPRLFENAEEPRQQRRAAKALVGGRSMLSEQRRLAGITPNLPGIDEAAFRNAKILNKYHRGSEIHYEVMDPVAGMVKAQSIGTKIDIQGHMDRRARFRVWSTIMRDIWGPAWNHLPKTVKRSVNLLLHKAGFDGNGRFVSVGDALGRATGILNAQKIAVSDPTSAHEFSGSSGRKMLNIEFVNNDDPFSPIPIRNSALWFSWQDLAKNGPYEVLAYLG